MSDLLGPSTAVEWFPEKFLPPHATARDDLNLQVWDWQKGQCQAQFSELDSIETLKDRPSCDVRIICTPFEEYYDLLSITNHTHCRLLHYLSVPSAFISENINDVHSAFGHRAGPRASRSCWFHFRCKAIVLTHGKRLRTVEGQASGQQYLWHNAGFFLKWRECGPEMDTKYPFGEVTLFCTGKWHVGYGQCLDDIRRRLGRISEHGIAWESVLHDPLILLDVIFSELFGIVEYEKTNLQQHIHWGIEKNVLGLGISDRPPGKPTQQIDFAALANASKHTIHVKESLDGVVQSLSQVCDFHEKYLSRNGAWLQRYADSSLVNDAVGDALRYQLSAFKAVAMRIDTLEKRIKMLNETAFNLVAQQNNFIMLDDSRSMFTVAIVTLVFLPFASVAAMLATPFFSLDQSGGISVTKNFWIMWAIVVPLTALVLLCWYLATKAAKGELHYPRVTPAWFVRGHEDEVCSNK